MRMKGEKHVVLGCYACVCRALARAVKSYVFKKTINSVIDQDKMNMPHDHIGLPCRMGSYCAERIEPQNCVNRH